jgi:hypothetical protein
LISEKGVIYLSAEEEDNKIIAQANSNFDAKGELQAEKLKQDHMVIIPNIEKEKLDLWMLPQTRLLLLQHLLFLFWSIMMQIEH